MKNIRLVAFITFSNFRSTDSVGQLLQLHHNTWSSKFEHWSLQSTQKRLEGSYWNMLVWTHFISLVAVLLLVTIVISHWVILSGWIWVTGLLTALIIFYNVLKIILYKPHYELHFLPLLQNAVQHLNGETKESISKAKSNQYKTFTLLLIQSVLQKLSGCSKLSDGNIQRELLCRQYGISNDTLDAPLKNLLSKPYNEQTPKLQTQIMDYFEEAKHYFDSLNSKEASALLEEIKLSLEQGKKLPF